MKKYFAKLFQEEGEIKEGDMVAFEGDMDDIMIYHKDTKTTSPYPVVNRLKYSDKKVKICLCSTEISPSDYLIEALVHIYHDNSYPPFKIIGEISHEATWVRQGDTFNETEIEVVEYIIAERAGNASTNEFYTNHLLEKRKIIGDHSDWWVDGEIKEAKTLVKIKGCCGHFH